MRRFIKPKNDYFSLSVNGGLPRAKLLDALNNYSTVGLAVRQGRCMMCKSRDIDQTGLCLICRTFMNDEEREAAKVYYE